VRGRAVYRHGSVTDTTHPKEINSVQSVLNSKDKLKMKQLFNGKHNPDFYYWDTNEDMWCDGKPEPTFYADENLLEHISFPVLTKLQYRSRGQGMNIHRDSASLQEQFADIKRRATRGGNLKYIERYHNYGKEYGIHVALDECVYACRKARLQDRHEYYRNDSNSCWYTQFDNQGNLKEDFKQPENWEAIITECNRLRKLIGLDITRMDVIVASNGRFKILECNSAPSIAEGTAAHYSLALPKIINQKYHVQ